MFNMLIGMGSSVIIMCVKSYVFYFSLTCRGTTDLGADTANINLTFIFLITSLLSSIIVLL